MLERIGLVFEIVTIILCIHQLYEKKTRWDFSTIILFLSMTFYLEMINSLSIDNTYSILVHLFSVVYCLYKFKESLLRTVITVFMYIILVGVIQFLVLILLAIAFPNNESVRVLLGGISTCAFSIFILPHLKIDVFRKAIFKKNLLTHLIFVFICIVMFVMMLQSRLLEQISIDTYIFAIPAVALMIMLVIRWDISSTSELLAKKELQTLISYQDNHDELINKVRINQHGIKNHIMTMISAPYIYKSYEKIVNAQNQYYGALSRETFYNNLILLENNTIEGFLFSKFNEAHSYNINIQYKIDSKIPKNSIPDYYWVEIMGILLDNAIEAIKDDDDPKMRFHFDRKNKKYVIRVENKFRAVKFGEIESWFKFGESSKKNSKNCGIGLYRLKQLSEELHFDICYKNSNINDEYWVVFELIFDE